MIKTTVLAILVPEASTADDLEMRICRDEVVGEYIDIETVEIYVR